MARVRSSAQSRKKFSIPSVSTSSKASFTKASAFVLVQKMARSSFARSNHRARERSAMSDWFRKRSWTPEDQADFWRRHRRCRSVYNRAQFLRIQAFHLAETRQLSCAHVERGDIFLQRGRVDEALAEYRKAIAQERVHPEARTQCWLSFGWTAVMHHRTELYDEAERILSERENEAMFPVDF